MQLKYRGWRALCLLSPVEQKVRCTITLRVERDLRVPEVNRNSFNDFNRNLGNFEKVWNDNNAVLSFCDLFISPPMLFGRRSFVYQAFLPATEQDRKSTRLNSS